MAGKRRPPVLNVGRSPNRRWSRRDGENFPKIPESSGKKVDRDARCCCSPWPNDSSFYNLEFLSERPNYRRTKGLLLLHAAADSVETWLYFSQSVSLRSSVRPFDCQLRSRFSGPRWGPDLFSNLSYPAHQFAPSQLTIAPCVNGFPSLLFCFFHEFEPLEFFPVDEKISSRSFRKVRVLILENCNVRLEGLLLHFNSRRCFRSSVLLIKNRAVKRKGGTQDWEQGLGNRRETKAKNRLRGWFFDGQLPRRVGFRDWFVLKLSRILKRSSNVRL